MIHPRDGNNEGESICSLRRDLLKSISTTLLLTAPLPASAGEVGAKITKAVTTSELGVSVRTSVVKGAQIMDKIDGRWENFSDTYSLGSERSKAGKRPTPKEIPDLLKLNVATAKRILEISDQAFCNLLSMNPKVLNERIKKVADLVQVSFERSGITMNSNNNLDFSNASQFNFAVYAHFKTYSDVLIENQITFGPFKRKFESMVGQQLVEEFLPNHIAQQQQLSSREAFASALTAVDSLCRTFRDGGLVAAYDIDKIDDDKINDWLGDLSDLEFNIALDNDATLNAQVLLQEQGFRLYPNFARYAISFLMSTVDPRQKVSLMDYYFDTDYSSDPEKFQVKEILLSVSLENP